MGEALLRRHSQQNYPQVDECSPPVSDEGGCQKAQSQLATQGRMGEQLTLSLRALVFLG